MQLPTSLTFTFWSRCQVATITFAKNVHQRKLAMMRLGEEGVRQGAEERSSLLSKLLFSRQLSTFFSWQQCLNFLAGRRVLIFFSWQKSFSFCGESCLPRYQGRCKGSVSDKGKMKSPFTFLSLSLPGSRSSSPAPQQRQSSHIYSTFPPNFSFRNK